MTVAMHAVCNTYPAEQGPMPRTPILPAPAGRQGYCPRPHPRLSGAAVDGMEKRRLPLALAGSFSIFLVWCSKEGTAGEEPASDEAVGKEASSKKPRSTGLTDHVGNTAMGAWETLAEMMTRSTSVFVVLKFAVLLAFGHGQMPASVSSASASSYIVRSPVPARDEEMARGTCLTGDELIFLQQLPGVELFELASLLRVEPKHHMAVTSSEWDSFVIESVR